MSVDVMGYCNPQVYIPTNVLQKNKSSYIVMLQTSYTQNYVARNILIIHEH